MHRPQSVAELTELGRVRLSEHFFMRDMLYSEVANFHGLPNVPEDPDLAIAAGENLCRLVLDPLHRAFGGIAVRSAYRSPTVNAFCHRRYSGSDAYYYCSDNEYNAARHIWDRRDADGCMGATASVVVPWYLDRYEKTGDFQPLAWWIRDHVEAYAELIFFPWLCAFNIRWYEGPSDRAIYRDTPDQEDAELMTKRGMPGFDGSHADRYSGFPELD
ncbi:MAG: hypothetical protein ACE5H8_02745 [Alphaproteobacteria bacterium]